MHPVHASVLTVAVVSIFALSLGCGSEPTPTRGDPAGAPDELPPSQDTPPADAPPALGGDVHLTTRTQYAPELAYAERNAREFEENFLVITARFAGANDETTFRLGILPGSTIDLRVRHDEVVLDALDLSFQDLRFKRDEHFPQGLLMHDLGIKMPEPTRGRVVATGPDQIDMEVSLDLDFRIALGSSAETVAALPPVAVRDLALVLSLLRDAETGAVTLRATGVKGESVLEVPGIFSVRDAWLDLVAVERPAP
jgi:hypothetical protein